ncbi:ATP-binding protein [Lentzea sp.]|uniref:ATP-binding protein n=1 Tax=Lentzea sp. TaxID=56099 RepID=UPI002B7E168D|nr:AAA family ATPase [Lentzea sp.]HUQ60361.1 AAA family ATPase [Lentzea sp.]
MKIDALRQALAAKPGQAVAFGELIDAVWGDERPANPKQALRNLVQRLRATEQVITEPGGYRLVLRKPGPHQLPADLPDFVGRTGEIAAALGSTAPVLAITGPPGVGKTSLAVHVAHRLSERFPDGQLYVNLHAFDSATAMTPHQALHRFLRALGAEEVPVDLDAQVELFRRMTADRAVLVVVDNATGDLVGPLLPSGERCRVLVTSRTDLAEHEQIRLAVFADDEAQELLARMRITGSPDDRAELVRLCANLPLALRIAAANVAAGHISDYLADLRGDDRLDALEIEGDAAVNAAFDLSYKAQPLEAQRLFRLLGLIPGQDFGAEAATALLGECADEPLRLLVAANLVHGNGNRYSLHDLLRMYAVHLTQDPSPRRRLFDYYLLNAEAAARVLNREFFRMDLPELAEDLPRHDPDSEAAAVAWLDAERANIVAAVQQAGADPVAWLLTDMLRGHFHFQAHHVDWFAAARAGLAAARQAGARVPTAVMHGSLGLAHWSTGTLADAVEEFGKALDVLRVHRDDRVMTSLLINSGIVNWELGRLRAAARLLGEALEMSPDNPAVLFNLGGVYLDLGPLSISVAHVTRALEIAEEQDLLVGRILALNAIVEVRQLLGDYDLAEEYLAKADDLRAVAPHGLVRRIPGLDSHAALSFVRGRTEEALEFALDALRHAQEANSSKDECDGYDTLGEIYRALGDVDKAMSAHDEALGISLKNGYLRGEVNALAGLAADHHAAGEPGEALRIALRARERAREGEMRVRGVRVLAVLARVQRSMGDHAAADEATRSGLNLAAETECRFWERDLLAQPPANGGSTSS